ncbi:hypothetical protein ADUPG1_011307, partial [Aduncisulcus paluster]
KYDRTNFIFLLDYSGSMNAEISADKSETKTRKDCLINALQSGVIDTLAAKFPHRSCPHLLSVCTFNDDCARVKLPHQEKLTPYNGRSWLSKLKETRPSGETIFSKGLQYARRSLRKRDYGNVLILFTDGANRESDERVTREEMKKLREKFDVYIIGIKDATSESEKEKCISLLSETVPDRSQAKERYLTDDSDNLSKLAELFENIVLRCVM